VVWFFVVESLVCGPVTIILIGVGMFVLLLATVIAVACVCTVVRRGKKSQMAELRSPMMPIMPPRQLYIDNSLTGL